MAGRRPRLVQEGSPLIDESDLATGVNNDFHHRSSSQSLGALMQEQEEGAKNNAIPNQVRGKAFKLKTTLVIGERALDEKDDQDDVMMDSDVDHHHHHHQGSSLENDDDSTSLYYASHGTVCHGREIDHHHYNDYPGHGMAIDTVHHQYQEIHQHAATNQFHNNNHFRDNNHHLTHLIHALPTTSNPSTLFFHMQPSPSISPLVVLDGANIAYNYSETLNPIRSQSSTSLLRLRQPDPRGIRVVIEYFLKHGCRVQAVVPTSWYQLKPRPGDTYHLKNRTRRGDSDARMVTDEVEELRILRRQGFLVAIPPGDDDDAYALALARREEDRLMEQQQQHGSSVDSTRQQQQQHPFDGMDEDDNPRLPLPSGGYVVSNDMFHDAIRRDENRQHQHQQQMHSLPLSARAVSLKSWLSRKRISYSFANVGTLPSGVGDDDDDDDGNTIRLDFIPNPRNELIDAIDARCRLHM